MSFDQNNNRYCDECGRIIKKAHRIFQDNDYCSTCYPRIFPKVECTLCGGGARPHRHTNSPAVCRSCHIKTRKCLRCNKAVPKAGKVINGQPVCPACTPYFNEPQTCTSCGKASMRVLRAPKFGLNNPMCQPCRRKLTHKTCSVCRKHRPIFGVTDDGKAYCTSCIPGQQKSHSCTGCGVSLPGKGRSRCHSCLNLSRLIKEADLHSLTLNRQWARELLIKFAIWLHARSGHQPNCFGIFLAHEKFFELIDAHFEFTHQIQEETLLENLGVALMRQHLLASIFLQESLVITIRSEKKSDSAENSRINEKLIKNSREPWFPLLKSYHFWLKDKEISTLTKRLYLRAAEKFCQTGKIKHDSAWNDNVLYLFLKKHPGSRASLFKFITYCRIELGWPVKIPSRTTLTPVSLSKKLKYLINQIKEVGVEIADLDLLSKMLALAFGYEHTEFVAHPWRIEKIDTTTILISDNEKIVVPTEYIAAALSWTNRRRI